MNNTTPGICDNASIQKDIDDRMQIIQHYQRTGQLNRSKAIEKIQELRIKDNDIAAVTSVRLAASSVPASQASDQVIIDELLLQIKVLMGKLLQNLR